MSDTREWLTDVRLLSKGDQTAAGQVIRATVDALLAVLDECDEINYQFGPDSARSLSGYPDGAIMASRLIESAINKALGVDDE